MSDALLDFLPIYSVPFVVVGIIMNLIHRNKYDRLMQYLAAHYPQIYEEIRIKPVWGPFYAKNAYRKSFDYANHHEPLDDLIAEELLADYASFGRKINILAIAFFLGFLGLICWFLASQ